MTAAAPQVVSERRTDSPGAPPMEPGWYPVRTNPNEQTYWDGSDWVGRRRWSAGTGWIEVSGEHVPEAATGAATATANGQRLSANPYAPHPRVHAVAPLAPGVTLGLALMAASAVAMMVGSVTTWVTSSAQVTSTSVFGGITFTASGSASGVESGMSNLIGINGFITLIAAVAILVFAGLMMVSDERSIRIVACLVSVVGLGVSIYMIVRLVGKLHGLHPARGLTLGVGWGAMLVVGAALMATLVTLFEVSRNR